MSIYRLPVKHLVYKMLIILCVHTSMMDISYAQFQVSVVSDISCNSAELSLSQENGIGDITYKVVSPSNDTTANIIGPSYTINGGGIYRVIACDDNGESINFVEIDILPQGVLSCRVKNITISLDSNGEFILTPDMIDDGSCPTTAPPIFTLSPTPPILNCSSVSPSDVTLTVFDGIGGSVSCVSKVSIAPSCGANNLDVNLDPMECERQVVLPVGSDNCGGTTVSSYMSTAPPTSDIFGIGEHDIQYLVTDASGNSSICDLRIKVNEYPEPICGVNILNIDLSSSKCDTLIILPEGPDNCAGVAPISSYLDTAPPMDSIFGVGEYDIQYVVTDASGNSSICDLKIQVNDITKPICGVDFLNIDLSPMECDTLVTLPIGTDNCMTPISNYSTAPPMNTFDIGTHDIKYTVTDASGNFALCDLRIQVYLPCGFSTTEIDLRPLQCDTLIMLPDSMYCGRIISSTIMNTAPPSDILGVGMHDVLYEATDAFGNSTICDLNIKINDYASSSFTCVNQLNLSLDPVTCVAVLTPRMLLTGNDYGCLDNCEITVTDDSGKVINRNFDFDDIDKEFTYEICCASNCCWGQILVEYKAAPLIECPVIDTITCAALDILGLPTATAQCGGGTFEVFLKDEVRISRDCDPDFSAEITRTYRTENSFGNSSECTHKILIERIDFGAIVFPSNDTIACDDPNYTFVNGIPLPYISAAVPTGSGSPGVPIICMPQTGTMGTPNFTGYAFAECGPDFSGVPLIPVSGATKATINGLDTIPSSLGQVCNSVVTYEDFIVSTNPCHRTVMRKFEVIEWYCNRDSSRSATHIIDVIDTTAPIFVCPKDFTVSSDEDCRMLVDFPPVTPTDGCGNGIIVKIDPDGSPLVNGNGGSSMLLTGVNQVTYTVSDSCYNSSSCMINVTVQDQVEPVAICESYTKVSLTNSGSTFLKAASLDDGSWDGCGIDKFEVRRMTTGCNQMDTLFGPQVEFCCTDTFPELMVIFRVFDTSENYNDCMVRVIVEDKLAKKLTCPTNMNIDCRDAFDPNNLALNFGEATLTGNCTITNRITEVQPDFNLNQCNIGYINRTFNLLDVDRSTVLDSCKQLIRIDDITPFADSLIQWPKYFASTSGVCTIDQVNPEDLEPLFAYPSFIGGDDQCSMLGFSHEDKLITTTIGGQCFRIERTWSVINWCDDTGSTFAQYTDPNGPQIIDVRNNVVPIVEMPDSITFQTSLVDCKSGLIEFERTGVSTCDSLSWTYIVRDLDEVTVATGDTVTVASGDTIVFSQVLDVGSYDIEWTISDICNNILLQEQALTVISDKDPTPVCINNMCIEVNTQDTIQLWASDFNAGSYQSCNNPIILSLKADTIDTNIQFSFSDIGSRTLSLYVTDSLTMAQAQCSFDVVIVEDGKCGDNMRVVIEGDVYTENFENIENVEISLINGDSMEMTDNDGHYAFADMPMGSQYIVVPQKDVDYLNGVSTLDLVQIQRHILNIQELDSPYKLIAADADDSHSVTAIDLIELRKLILGVSDELPQNSSWRFVDADHQFLDALNPWVFKMPEDYFISQLEGDMELDFIGVKIGDVNGSVVPNLKSHSIGNRASRWPLSFVTENKIINNGQSDYISFYSDSYERVSGWQMTLEYDAENIDILSIKSDVIDIDESQYNIASQDQGWITISYNGEEPIDVGPSEPIFKIGVSAHDQVRADNIFSITSKVTHAEAYRGLSEIVNIQLRIQELSTINIITARPNPWKNHTDIEFNIPADGECKWEVFDLSGQLIHTYTAHYNAGNNSYRIDRSLISAAGVYYVKLTTKEQSEDYKLVVIE